MEKSIKVPFGPGVAEYVEKKSRFIGQIFPVSTAEEAQEQIRALQKKYWDATHNVYAYILENGVMRFSDDGEPQGTSGMPTLEVLKKEGVCNVLCVTTRYFGGTLLGAGGLVRAYSHAAKIALDAAGIAEMVPFSLLELRCPYDLYDPVRKLLPDFEAEEKHAEYGADITVTIALPAEQREALCLRLTDLSRGRLSPRHTGDLRLPKRIG